MRLIDADALLDAISVHLERIEQEFDDAPTIDTVRHGRWIVKWWDEDGDARDWACSVCGFSHVYFDDMPTNYCPKCGAIMDGGEDEESEE